MPLFDGAIMMLRLLIFVCSGCEGTRAPERPNHRWGSCPLNPKKGGPGPLPRSLQGRRVTAASAPIAAVGVPVHMTNMQSAMAVVSVVPPSQHAHSSSNERYSAAVLEGVQRRCTQNQIDAVRAVMSAANCDNYEDICAEWNDNIASETVCTPTPPTTLQRPYCLLLMDYVRARQHQLRTLRGDKYTPKPSGAGFMLPTYLTQEEWDNCEETAAHDPNQAPSTRHRWLFDRKTKLTSYSITIMVSKKNIPAIWFKSFCKFLDIYIKPGGGKGFVGLEAGNRKGHLHLQSTLQARTGGNSAQCTAKLKDIISTEVITHMVGRKIQVKPLTGLQDVFTMIGYCMKDRGTAHYQSHAVNLTSAELERCEAMYAVVRSSHEDGRKMITKRSIIKVIFQEWNTHLRPLDVPADVVLMWIMQSGGYMPSCDWVAEKRQGVDMAQMDAMWKMARYPARTTHNDIIHLFFNNNRRFTMARVPDVANTGPNGTRSMYVQPPRNADPQFSANEIESACTEEETSTWSSLAEIATNLSRTYTMNEVAVATDEIKKIRRAVTTRIIADRLDGTGAFLDTDGTAPEEMDEDDEMDEEDAFSHTIGPPLGKQWSDITYSAAKELAGRARAFGAAAGAADVARGHAIRQFPGHEDSDEEEQEPEQETEFDPFAQ